MKILIINGSPRKKSYTKILANFVYEYVKEKYDTEFLDLGKEPIEPFRGFEEKYNEKTTNIVSSLKNFDIFIICSPVYNGLLSSAIKNLFEHVNYKELIGKTAGFILMAGGKISYLQVQGQLNALMNYFTIISNPKAIYVGKESFNDKMEVNDNDAKERIKIVIDSTINLKK